MSSISIMTYLTGKVVDDALVLAEGKRHLFDVDEWCGLDHLGLSCENVFFEFFEQGSLA